MDPDICIFSVINSFPSLFYSSMTNRHSPQMLQLLFDKVVADHGQRTGAQNHVTQVTWPSLERDIIMAAEQLTDGSGKRMSFWAWIMSDAQWAIHPLSFDAADPLVRKARPVQQEEPLELIFVDVGGTNAERATHISVHNMLDKQRERNHAAWEYSHDQHTIFRAFALNHIVFTPEAIEEIRGPVTQFGLDPLHVIWARVRAYHSVLDDDSYKQTKSLYEQPWHGSFPAFFTKELETSQHHVANGLGLTDREKLMSFFSLNFLN
jgi:hypothetical protein